jgi:flavin reductase (DIM6/NTAB) family NADH-FMN oxidoreductase RutF
MGPDLSPDAFRQAAGSFASGVTVVSTRVGDLFYGVTVSSFASLSLNPLLISVSLNENSALLQYVEQSGSFAVSILARGQEDVSAYFSSRQRRPTTGGFETVNFDVHVTGAPVIRGCLSFFDCRLHESLPGGDHRILVGQVVRAGGGDGEPLLYWRGGYRGLHGGDDEPADDNGIQRFADSLSVQMHLLGVGAGEMVEAQHTIEPTVAELAARRATNQGVAELNRIAGMAEDAIGDIPRFNEASIAFHAALCAVADNRPLQAALLALRRVQEVEYAGMTRDEAIDACSEHRSILDAVAAHDPEAARAAMTDHVHAIRRRLGAEDA